jgi:hypothetical protein
VLKKCGEPLLKEPVGEKILRNGSSYNKIFIEKWAYDMGKYRFTRILTFYGMELVNIERGEKL